jgi:flagellar basal-body rod protein FlgB
LSEGDGPAFAEQPPAMIPDLFNSGGMPALEMGLRFAAERQKLLASNIANFNTPNYRPLDVSTDKFQAALARAIDDRRAAGPVAQASMGASAQARGLIGAEPFFKNTDEVRVRPDGSLELSPRTPSGNILFHDRNNRDLERNMQALAENSAYFRTSAELLRSRFELLRTAISQRV